MSRKVVHLSSAHPTTDTRIFHKECCSLTDAGFDVCLIARGDFQGSRNGVRIRRVPSRPDGRLVRMTRSVFDVFRMAIQERGDAYQFHDPELIPVGLLLKALGKRVIYDVHEHVAKDIATKPWIPRFLRTPVALAFSILEHVSAHIFDGVIVATPSIAEAFPGVGVVTIQNFPLLDQMHNQAESHYNERPSRVIYIGAITGIRGIFEMVRSLDMFENDEHVRMTLAGSFAPPKLEVQVEQEPGWICVDFVGQLSRGEVGMALQDARIGLVLFQPVPNHIDSQPNKLFEYMSAGLPVIASDFPYWKQFISDIGSGLMVDPLDTGAISDAIRWLLEHPVEAEEMGKRGREAVLTHYSWEGEARKLVDFYRQQIFAGDSVRYETR